MRQIPVLSRLCAFVRSCLWWDRPFLKNVLVLMLPMVFQELVGASLHILDGLMVSGLGDAAYSGVLQANRYTFLVQLLIFGVASGSAIFLSQYWGAQDVPRMRHAMGLALWLSVLVSLFFAGAVWLFPRPIVACFLPEGESFTFAVDYLTLVAPSFLFSAISHVYATTLKAAEKTYIPMIASLVGLAADTVLNYGMIYGKLGFPALGVRGAALSTVLSPLITLGILLAFAYGKKLPAGAALKDLFCRDLAFIKAFFKTVAPVIFNEGFWALGMTMYGVFYGRMGDVSITAMGLNSSVGDLLWVGIMGMTNAAAIVVGKTLGQGDKDLAYLYSKRFLAGGVVLAAAVGLIMAAFHRPLVGIFTGLSPQVRDKAGQIIVFASLFLWARAFNCINVVGLLRSGGDTLYSLLLDAGAMWLIGVPAVAVASLVFHWPIESVYLCTLLDEFVKIVIGVPHFRKKQWMKVLTKPKEEHSLGNA